MEQLAFRVDERLQIGSERATVRYIGQVTGQSGQWVGLEWDNETRGKHDGCVQAQRYFECLYSGMLAWRAQCGRSIRLGKVPNETACAGAAGSFVRLEKLQQTARAGISVLQGLRARYQGAAGAATASQSGLVGERQVWERQGQIQLLDKASLSGDAVSSPVRQA
jgi:CAP-Gly domain